MSHSAGKRKQAETDALDLKDKTVIDAMKRARKIYNDHLDDSHVPAGVTADNPRYGYLAAPPDVQKKVQTLAASTGCWECGKKLSQLENSWIGDHIHPWSFNKKEQLLTTIAEIGDTTSKPTALGHWGIWKTEMWLLPSCVACSRKQSSLVRKLKTKKGDDLAATVRGLSTKEWKLIGGGRDAHAKKGVTTRDTKGAKAIWSGDLAIKCHACPAKKSFTDKDNYTADHYPPQELNTAYAVKIFEDRLDLGMPEGRFLPHCPICSSKQGAGLKKVAKELQDIAKILKVTVYK